MSKELKEVKEADDKDIGAETFEWSEQSQFDNFEGLDLVNFVYGKVDASDKDNLAKKLALGWETVSDIEGGKAVEHIRAKSKLDQGANLTPGTLEYRGVILMKLPKYKAEARKRFYEKKSKEQIDLIERKAKSEGQGVVYGSVSVNKQKYTFN